MKKYVCDICGKDCKYEDYFILPMHELWECRGGAKRVFTYSTGITAESCNLCAECIIKIADFVRGITECDTPV